MITKPEHEVAYHDLLALLRKHSDKVSDVELLAIAANMLGKILAMQDQRTMTMQRALKIIGENFEIGNQHVIEKYLGKTEGSA
jgi:hypothetical protein